MDKFREEIAVTTDFYNRICAIENNIWELWREYHGNPFYASLTEKLDKVFDSIDEIREDVKDLLA